MNFGLHNLPYLGMDPFEDAPIPQSGYCAGLYVTRRHSRTQRDNRRNWTSNEIQYFPDCRVDLTQYAGGIEEYALTEHNLCEGECANTFYCSWKEHCNKE